MTKTKWASPDVDGEWWSGRDRERERARKCGYGRAKALRTHALCSSSIEIFCVCIGIGVNQDPARSGGLYPSFGVGVADDGWVVGSVGLAGFAGLVLVWIFVYTLENCWRCSPFPLSLSRSPFVRLLLSLYQCLSPGLLLRFVFILVKYLLDIKIFSIYK